MPVPLGLQAFARNRVGARTVGHGSLRLVRTCYPASAMMPAATRPIQVHLVALPLVCWGLEHLVRSAHPRFEVAAVTASIGECVSVAERSPADVVVIDLDSCEGAEPLAELRLPARTKPLLLTSSPDVALLDRAVLAGVRGVVKKREPPAVLLKAIEKVHEGELWIDRGATSRIFLEMARQKVSQRSDPEASKIATLTGRERQTILALASDASAPGKVIAGRLCISEHTLRNHLTSIYGKLGLSNRLDLYAYATKHSLNKPG
jgi:two-component system, NarL family, nitrate/nitrite response regulator NarL